MLAFDNGASSEFNTLPTTDWMAHALPEVLAKNFGVPADAFNNIPLQNRWIFQGKVPGPLAEAQAAVASKAGASEYPIVFSLYGAAKASETASGCVQIADSSNVKVSRTVAAGLVTVKPGGLRTMHWPPNADQWQYYMQGSARMTVLSVGPAANTANLHPGDIGYVKKGLGHYSENAGTIGPVFVALFRAPYCEEVLFSDWLARTPPEMVAATFNLERDRLRLTRPAPQPRT